MSHNRQYRRWTTEQKLRILSEVREARAKDVREGTKGAVKKLLQKYDLKTGHLAQWRQQLGERVDGLSNHYIDQIGPPGRRRAGGIDWDALDEDSSGDDPFGD